MTLLIYRYSIECTILERVARVGLLQLYCVAVLMGGGYFLGAKGCDDCANTHVLLAANSVCVGNWGHRQNGQILAFRTRQQDFRYRCSLTVL